MSELSTRTTELFQQFLCALISLLFTCKYLCVHNVTLCSFLMTLLTDIAVHAQVSLNWHPIQGIFPTHVQCSGDNRHKCQDKAVAEEEGRKEGNKIRLQKMRPKRFLSLFIISPLWPA